MPGKKRPPLRTSSATQNLPPELAEFLSRDTYSLLIKGESGTGKTLLSLTILKALQPVANPLYLSTRISPLQLVENYPWAEDIFGLAAPQQKEGSETEGWETLVDARLDEPNVIFERITNVLMDKQAPTIVIDSWESLSDTLGTEALRTNIRVLQTWRERAGARFIFIGEDPGNSAIDFMVEGIVVLKDRVADGRRLREIVLSKLHGVQISRPSYFFTLEGGRFTSFPGYSPQDYLFREPLPVSLDRPFHRVKGRYPTGYPSLDGHLDGGFPARSTVVIEVDRGVDPKVGLIFLSRAVQDWLAVGDRVVVDGIHDIDKRYLSRFSKSFGHGVAGRLITSGGSITEYGRRDERSALRRWSEKTMVIVGAEGVPTGKPNLTVVLGKTGDISQETVDRAATRLKFAKVDGTLFMACEAPWSGLYAVVPGMTGGNPMVQLEPVV